MLSIGATLRAVLRAGMRAAWLLGMGAGLIISGVGCYNPKIQEGGFLCATAGTRCPEGFSCAADNRCRKNPVPIPDAGEPMCKSPPVTPTCQEAARAGNDCNPTCQKGCDCGRCNVVGSVARCVPTGTMKLGEICTLGNADNCGAGLICLQEVCGNGLGRCYRHCSTTDQCEGTICQIPIEDAMGKDTGFRTCDVPGQACDPVNNTGCPSPALNCYLTSANQTLCDCPNNPAQMGMNNDPCTIYSDCAAGFVCISGVGGVPGAHCHFTCNVASPSCPSGRCIPAGTGAMYGYCGS
jgi:hypothetical protein